MKLPEPQCGISAKKSDSFKQTIYLVRHGETDPNVKNTYQGKTLDPGLNEKGRKQVYRLALYLEKEVGNVKTIYTSPMRRALDTMAIIAHILSKPGKKGPDGQILPKMIIEPGLAEIDHGAWDGKTAEEVKKIWPEIFETWQSGNQNRVEFPGGESVVRARKRVFAGFQNILKNDSGEKIIIAAHGGANALILAKILKAPLFKPIRQSNACLNIIERNFENNKNDLKIALMNGPTHL